MSYKRVIVLLADGARADVMSKKLFSGELPNIEEHITGPGSALDAVTSFPSTTGPAYLPFLTGCLPGTCNVPGIRWVDKVQYEAGTFLQNHRSYVGFESFLMASDIRPHIKTIFETIPDSISIFNPIARGAGSGNRTWISRIWYWYYSHLTDHWSFADENATAKVKASIADGPEYIFAVFPGIDEYAHIAGVDHPSVDDRYSFLDRSVGEIVEELKSRGEWESTAMFIVSDHGLTSTHTHFCVNGLLEEYDLAPFFYPLIFDKKGKRSANMVSGNGMTHVYFKNDDGWARHTVVDELERIAPGIIDDMVSREAIDIVAYRMADGWIGVRSKRGEARMKLDASKISYEVVGSDPFGYESLPREMESRECLKLTIDSEYPDAPFQITDLMATQRAGDVVISAKPGFDLRLKYEHPEHRGSHGSLHRHHMRVPFLTNVPFEENVIRTVDLFPTVLSLLGRNIPDYVDGVGLKSRS
jgi:type I phosphodiesterase/nucleotide pyrophosphatase